MYYDEIVPTLLTDINKEYVYIIIYNPSGLCALPGELNTTEIIALPHYIYSCGEDKAGRNDIKGTRSNQANGIVWWWQIFQVETTVIFFVHWMEGLTGRGHVGWDKVGWKVVE